MKAHQLSVLSKSMIIGLFLVLFGSIATAEVLEIEDLTTARNIAQDQAELYSPERVLVVFDIDNTLLATTQNLGSDQWYEWQSEMIESGEFEHAVAADIGGLLRIQAQLYSLSPMRQTQSNTAEIVATLQQNGHQIMALTARGPVNRDATLRELKGNGIRLQGSAPVSGRSGRYLPVDPENPELAGLTDAEITSFSVQNPRPVSYEHGVMMVAGQHKGAMLRTIIHQMPVKPRAVVFVDDKLKNVRNVDLGLAPLGIEVFSLRYGKEDRVVADFNQGNKAQVIADWDVLRTAIGQVFGQ